MSKKEPDVLAPEVLDPVMPQIMDLLPDLNSLEIPSRDWGMGLFKGWYRKRKLDQILREEVSQANIAKFKTERAEERVKQMITIVTLAARLQSAIEREKSVGELARASVVKAQLENKLLYHQVMVAEIEARNAELDFHIKQIEWRKMDGGSPEEDRND